MIFHSVDKSEKVIFNMENSRKINKNVRHILYPLPFCYLLHFNMYIDIIKY